MEATAAQPQAGDSKGEFEAMRRLYEATLSNLPDFVYVFGVDCRIKYANVALLKVWGKRLDEVVGRTLLEIGNEPWQAERHEQEIRKVAATRKPFRAEVQYAGTNGPRVYDYVFAPVFGADGEVEAVTGVARDVTEEVTSRKLAETQTQLQRETLEQILRGDPLESILNGLTSRVEQTVERPLIATILVVEPDGVTMRSVAGERSPAGWTEFLRGFAIGPEVGSCGSAAWSGQRIVVEDVATDRRWAKYREEALKHNLRACWSTPIFSSQKKVLGTFAIYYPQPGAPTEAEIALVDLLTRTASIAIERNRSEAALEAARRKLANYAETLESKVAQRTASLQEAVSQMEEFSYTVSHDLRAPLRGMMVYSKALQEDYSAELPAEARRFVAKIAENADRLDRMILDVLTFSRLSRSAVSLGPVDLNALIAHMIEEYEFLQPHKARLVLEPLLPVIAHEPSLTQAISNLLNNAVKFVGPGVVPQVRVRSERRERNVRLWIEDNGIGIDPTLHRRLFNMFERVHPNLSYDGSGVGLAIVRKAVERMNGACGVESDGANGSQFWIELKGLGT